MPSRSHHRCCFLIPLLLISTLLCLVAPQAQAADEKESFTEWLEDFQAWDVLQDQLSRQSSTPQTVLKRAKLLLRLQKPDEALQLLEKAGAFQDKAVEAERQWLKARAYRMQQKPVEALIQYSQAAEAMSTESRLDFMRSEPDLDWYWKVVWKKWYWDRFTGTHLLANQGQQGVILRSAVQAGAAWPEDSFWTYAADIIRASLESESKVRKDQGAPSPSLLAVDRPAARKLATSLAAASSGNMQAADRSLREIRSGELRLVWRDILVRLYGEDLEDALQAEALDTESRYVKYTAFQEWALPAMQQLPEATWRIREPSSQAWQRFRKNLLSLPPDRALDRLQKELESTLLAGELKRTLAQYSLAFALMAGKFEAAGKVWAGLNKAELPLSLKVCGLLLGFQDAAEKSLFEETQTRKRRVFAFFTEMLGPADFWASHLVTSFWVQPEEDNGLQELQTQYPLDRLLNYSLDRRRWGREKTEEQAKQAALLYPDSSLRNDSLFYLAQRAHERGKVQQAWRYVQKMDQDMLSPEGKADFLLAKAGLLMEMGRESESLAAYRQILDLAPERLPLEKKLKLALMAQRHGEWEWAQSILQELWAKREELSTALRAEVMFWLGEGAQKRGENQEALEKYLKLAWEYPQEHIWAVTALYRSALIYEQQGRLQAAKRLLEQVMERADRESQKEAAKDRIEAIERKLDQGVAAPELDYLF